MKYLTQELGWDQQDNVEDDSINKKFVNNVPLSDGFQTLVKWVKVWIELKWKKFAKEREITFESKVSHRHKCIVIWIHVNHWKYFVILMKLDSKFYMENSVYENDWITYLINYSRKKQIYLLCITHFVLY